jgi:uncharacterized glyoxalase superfamily protein PhnB
MSNTPHYPLAVMFTSKDMKRAVAFYRDKLGFDLETCWPDEANPQWANMVLDKQSIMLGAMMTPDAAAKMCGDDAGAAKYMQTLAQELEKNRPGVGVVTYVMVPDVDAYHARLSKNGIAGLSQPKSQFYGIRDFGLEDPDGYRLLFYTPVAMSACQSCGMPLKDAAPGTMYCGYCTDDRGKLKPYETVLEGTTTGYFMAMQKLPRPEAEKAARKHLATMPAWKGRQ